MTILFREITQTYTKLVFQSGEIPQKWENWSNALGSEVISWKSLNCRWDFPEFSRWRLIDLHGRVRARRRERTPAWRPAVVAPPPSTRRAIRDALLLTAVVKSAYMIRRDRSLPDRLKPVSSVLSHRPGFHLHVLMFDVNMNWSSRPAWVFYLFIFCIVLMPDVPVARITAWPRRCTHGRWVYLSNSKMVKWDPISEKLICLFSRTGRGFTVRVYFSPQPFPRI